MVVSFENLFLVISSPPKAFRNLREQPKWLVAFLFISFLSIIAAWRLIPFSEQLSYQILAQRLGEEQAGQAISMVERLKYIEVAFVPIGLLLRWLVLTAVLYFASILLSAPDELKFKSVYSLVVHSETILVLAGLLNVIILNLKGVYSIHAPADLQAIVGLDFFLKNRASNLSLFTLLNAINVFNIWYIAVLTIGISVATGFKKFKSAILVTTVWLLGVGFHVALTAISSNSPLGLGN
ncbi:MAG: hypothetical protein COS95_09515 [Ignavibacteriales bacterium CG07_land_8_20_14_0_80_59_12]|nr:MAG: hypothetical protein COS95_09515 [Ignavibacteriales bacterium CG07_land_8_20_14_0_80_59_12]